MRKTLLASTVLALAGALAASASAPGVADTAPPEPDVDGLFVLAEPATCSADPAADEIAALFQPVASHCPWGAPHCRRHDDCDAYCGDPRFGFCSTFTGCCGCTG